ncbi:hypothetical protein J2045_002738 [Peteryoungia aggregata LMG 23059]|uniref:Uncharacterized protein n=1 Tax=Peteryoungia aggregata LMG 23059 TaxID=1368425 RepID=A0ABU0G8M7_9HYPH|nr:hypothetical protein [Peteryoungia aggregata]MDQ0421698.1 hypothetical protein [Peteryoungia aggregata LMG 23059]
MKRLLIFIPILSVLAAIPAQAQQSTTSSATADARPTTVEDACIFVAKSMLMVKDLEIGVVQAFPELDPPGARLTYSTRMDAEPQDITDEIECQFERAADPLLVTRFCMDVTCYAANSEKPEERRRFEEIRALMQRLD